MGYEIGVTEVGPAEYPLIEVLRETVFAECGHRSLTTVAEDLEGKQDVLALIAHLEGNPIGFKVGHRADDGVYYSKTGGVLKDYRRLSLARRMQDWQHQFARGRGYRTVYFNSFNHFRAMMGFGLGSGFLPTAAEWRPPGAISFKFAKDLTGPDAPRRRLAHAKVEIEWAGRTDSRLLADLASLRGPLVSEDAIRREMDAPGAAAWLARVDGKPIGFATGRDADAPGTFVTRRLLVHEAWQERGVAAALVAGQVRAAAEHGYAAVRWDIDRTDAALLRASVELEFDWVGMRYDAGDVVTRILAQRSLAAEAANA